MSVVADCPATLTPVEHRLLGRAAVSVHPAANALSEACQALKHLAERGLMTETVRADWGCDYRVTRAGRDAYVSYRGPYVPITRAPPHDL